MEIIGATNTAPSTHPAQHPQQFKTLTEPLWTRLTLLLEEGDDNRYQRGKVLNELSDLYAEHGVGTFCSRLAAMEVATTSAYRWIDYYRKRAGLPPLGARKFEADDDPLPEAETQKATSSGGQSTVRDSRYILSERIALSAERKPIWLTKVKTIIGELASRGYTNENGQPLDNKHDAVFEAVVLVANHLEAENAAQDERAPA